jgi:hypothetical protein
LDLNISTLPIEAFGGEDMAGLTPDQDAILRQTYNFSSWTNDRTDAMSHVLQTVNELTARTNQIEERINKEIWVGSTGGSPNLYDDLRKGLAKLDSLSAGGVDITALSRQIVAALTPIVAEGLSDVDIQKMTRAMADLLANLLAQPKK